MKKILNIFAVLLLISGTANAAEQVTEKPLVVIRFNQPHIAYQDGLYMALNKALEVKPQAKFAVVAVAPISADKYKQKEYSEKATKNADNVVKVIKSMGMPESRLTQTNSTEKLDFSEVRVFVK